MLNDEERAVIEAAVREAEARTRGEIYCVAAEASSVYREVPLAWAAGAALVGPALLLLGGITVTVPELLDAGWTAAQVGGVAQSAVRQALTGAILLQGVLFLVVILLASIAPVHRVLTPRSLKRRRVRRRAQEQFMAKSLHHTRERTGVLIYVSLEERMAELIADEGIAEKVAPEVWDRAMAALTEGMKRGQAGAGFAAAVGLCGDVLAEHFPPRLDNPNELPDHVVMLPR